MSVNFFISCCLDAQIYITKYEQELQVFTPLETLMNRVLVQVTGEKS